MFTAGAVLERDPVRVDQTADGLDRGAVGERLLAGSGPQAWPGSVQEGQRGVEIGCCSHLCT